MAYRDYGEGPGLPLICLSGLTRNAGDFHFLALRHATARRVIALDYRGRGQSAWDASGRSYRPEVYVSDLRHLLAALGLGRVVICGASLGGYLAMGLALLAPAALAGVILNDCGPDPDLGAIAEIQRYMEALVRQPPADWAAAKASLKAALPDLGLASEADWDHFTAGTFVERDGRLAISWDPALNQAVRRRPPPSDLWPLFKAITALPVLLFRGEHSRFLPPASVARMQALHPGLRAVTVPGAGHTPTLLEPASLEPVDEFLARLDQRRGH